MNKLLIVLGLVFAQHMSFAQWDILGVKDSLFIKTDRGVKVKVAVLKYTDVSNIDKVDSVFKEVIKNKLAILKSVENGDYPIRIIVKTTSDGNWSIKTKDYPEYGKELAFDVNGGLVKNKTIADTLSFQLSGEMEVILVLDDFSKIELMSDLSLDKLIYEFSGKMGKHEWTQVQGVRGEYELKDTTISDIEMFEQANGFTNLLFGPNASLLKGKLSPGIDVKLVMNLNNRHGDFHHSFYLRSSFNYIFEFDEKKIEVHPQTFLKMYYAGNAIKPIFGDAYLGVGMLLKSKNNFYKKNMYSLSFLFPLGEGGPVIGLDLNFEDDLSSFHPGLNLNF